MSSVENWFNGSKYVSKVRPGTPNMRRKHLGGVLVCLGGRHLGAVLEASWKCFRESCGASLRVLVASAKKMPSSDVGIRLGRYSDMEVSCLQGLFLDRTGWPK